MAGEAGDRDARVRVESLDFEGPLDLLVYLVQRNEVDIWDIPIATITEQFLAYLEAMSPERLENAGEFLVMAATLLRIKARMLLPDPEIDDEEIEDPRRELVLRILEYQQYKEIADRLRDREDAARHSFPKGIRERVDLDLDPEPADPDPDRRASLRDLLQAFAELMRQTERDRVHHLEPIRVTIEEKVDFIRARIRSGGRTTFRDLFVEGEPRAHWIVTFVALLELARELEVKLRQNESFGEIHVYAGERLGDAAPDA